MPAVRCGRRSASSLEHRRMSSTAGDSRTDGLPTPRRYVAIAAVSLGTILTIVDGSIVNVALPTLARDLHVDPASAVLVVTVYQFVLMAAVLPLSALSQRFGYRQTYQFGQEIGRASWWERVCKTV